MDKKIYINPSMEVIELGNTDILAGSDGPQDINLHDGEVGNYDDHEHEVDTRDVWGKQF